MVFFFEVIVRYIGLIGWKGKILSTYSVILNRYQIIGDSELAPNTNCRNGFRLKEYPTFEIKKIRPHPLGWAGSWVRLRLLASKVVGNPLMVCGHRFLTFLPIHGANLAVFFKVL